MIYHTTRVAWCNFILTFCTGLNFLPFMKISWRRNTIRITGIFLGEYFDTGGFCSQKASYEWFWCLCYWPKAAACEMTRHDARVTSLKRRTPLSFKYHATCMWRDWVYITHWGKCNDTMPNPHTIRHITQHIGCCIDNHQCRESPRWWIHDDVLKWEHFPRYWPFVRGIRRSSVNSPHKGQ